MIAALISYVLGIMCIANAGEVTSPILAWTNWVLAVLFIITGSLNGWNAARR